MKSKIFLFTLGLIVCYCKPCISWFDKANEVYLLEKGKFMQDSISYKFIAKKLYKEAQTLDDTLLGSSKFRDFTWKSDSLSKIKNLNLAHNLSSFFSKKGYKNALAWSRNEIFFYPNALTITPKLETCSYFEYQLVYTHDGSMSSNDTPNWRFDRISKHWYVRSSVSDF